MKRRDNLKVKKKQTEKKTRNTPVIREKIENREMEI